VRDYSASINDAEAAIAQTIGNLRLLEQDHAEDISLAQDWGRKAVAASAKADQLRSAGNVVDADKFDNLAKVALGKQLSAESEARAVEPTITSQTQTVDQLKRGLEAMKGKLDELRSRRDQLVARAKIAQAQNQVIDAVKSIDIMDSSSELGRFEEKIRREEAKVMGRQELAASTLDAQFEALEDAGVQTEIEARLAALKLGSSPQALSQ
jgi:phage shock protein A